MLRNKLTTACSVAVLMAALYGCSSKSDDGANMQVQDLQDQIAALNAELGEGEELTPEALAALIQDKADAEADVTRLTGELGMANADVTRLTGELGTANADLGTANADVTRLTGELGMANADVTRLTGELGTANADLGTANADVTRLTGELGMANADVTRLTGELGTATSDIADLREALRLAGVSTAIATANSEYVAAKKAYDGLMAAYGMAAADVDAATAVVSAANAAKAKADAAQTVAGSGTVAQMTAAAANVAAANSAVSAAQAELQQATTTVAAMPYAMAIMEQATEPMALGATATRTGNAVEVSVNSAPDNTLIAKGSGSDAGHGWYRANVANEDGDQTATVYTNIENTMAKFNEKHTAEVNGYISGVTLNGVLELESMGQFDELNKYVSAAEFPAANRGEQTITYDGSSDDPKKFDGTFDGVPGQYACTTSDDCSATINAKGELTALVGDWTFIPAYLGEDEMSIAGDDDPANVESREDDLSVPNVAVPDVDYLWYGSWAQVAENGTVDFQTFFGGLQPSTVDTIGDLEGSATYNGPSAGRYAVKTFNSNSTLDSIRHGQFTAAAELTASFGGDAIAAVNHFSIKGEVTDFVGENGDDLAGWSVELMRTKFTAATVFPLVNGAVDNTDGDVGGGVGGSPVTSGSWNGEFFGDNPATEDTDKHPLSVAGEFDAHSSHGHVAGGFGAVKVKQ